MDPTLASPVHMRTLIAAADSPEVPLPDHPPLTLTRNFAWVFAACLCSLVVAPLTIAWTASLFFAN